MISPRPVVYVIGCREWTHEGKNYYKIGRSIHPHNRMKQLKQHFNRKNLKFRFLFETCVDGESEVEKHLHRTFRKQATRGERKWNHFAIVYDEIAVNQYVTHFWISSKWEYLNIYIVFLLDTLV